MKSHRIFLFAAFIFLCVYSVTATPNHCSEFYEKNNILAFKIDAFHAFDKDNLLIVCSAGLPTANAPHYLLASKNGGKSWQVRWTETNLSLEKIFFFDRRTGFVTGRKYSKDSTQSLILKTVDAGISWKPILLPIGEYLKDIQFIDRQNGFAVTDEGTLLKTSRGGEKWEIVNNDDFKWNRLFSVEKMFFSDKSNGWLLTTEERFEETEQGTVRDGNIYQTRDGGKNWSSRRDVFENLLKQWKPIEISFRAISFDSSKTIYIAVEFEQIERKPNDNEKTVTYNGVIFSSRDGGNEWTIDSLPNDTGLRHTELNAKGKFWIIPAFAWSDRVIFSSSDKGQSWQAHSTRNLECEPREIYFLNEKVGWIITDCGMNTDNLYRTLDGGKNWELR